jgi:hypothetical protein
MAAAGPLLFLFCSVFCKSCKAWFFSKESYFPSSILTLRGNPAGGWLRRWDTNQRNSMMGFAVTGIDPSEQSIRIAADHANASGLHQL